MSGNGIAKNQHYVPRFLLKNFTQENEQLFVFDKQNSNVFKTNIKKIVAEKGFYNFDFEGTELTLEQSLSHVEADAAKVIQNIIDNQSLQQVSKEDYLLLALFIAIQFNRTPNWRTVWEDLHDGLAEKIEGMGFKLEDVEGYVESTPEGTKLEHMMGVAMSHEFMPYLLNKHWVLLKATPEMPYWISDNPITLQNQRDLRPYGNMGFNSPGIEIYFPVSSELTIALWCPSLIEQIQASYKDYRTIKTYDPSSLRNRPEFKYIEELMTGVKERVAIPTVEENIINLNSLQVGQSSRFVLSSSKDFSLAEQMLDKNPSYREGGRKMKFN